MQEAMHQKDVDRHHPCCATQESTTSDKQSVEEMHEKPSAEACRGEKRKQDGAGLNKEDGRRLFKAWNQEQQAKKKEAELVAKATRVKDELLDTSCSQLTLLSPRTACRVLVYDQHFFLNYVASKLTVWHMSEDDYDSFSVESVVLSEEKEVMDLLPFLVDFIKKHTHDSE